MFSASLFFLRLECHFHGCCTSFNFRVLLTLFMSTAPIIVKKERLVKKKIFQKALFSADFPTFPQMLSKKFYIKKEYLVFFQKFLLYVVYSSIFHFFWTSFSLNLWITFAILKTILSFCAFVKNPTGYTAIISCYPQPVNNFVDNFFLSVKKLWTFPSVNYMISLRKTSFSGSVHFVQTIGWVFCG